MKLVLLLLFLSLFAVQAQDDDEYELSEEYPVADGNDLTFDEEQLSDDLPSEELQEETADEDEVSDKSELALAEEKVSDAILTAAAACALRAGGKMALKYAVRRARSSRRRSRRRRRRRRGRRFRIRRELAEDELAEDSEDELSEMPNAEGEVSDGLACTAATKALQLAWKHRRAIARGVKRGSRAVGRAFRRVFSGRRRRFRRELQEESEDELAVTDGEKPVGLNMGAMYYARRAAEDLRAKRAREAHEARIKNKLLGQRFSGRRFWGNRRPGHYTHVGAIEDAGKYIGNHFRRFR